MADAADQDFGKIAVELKFLTQEQLDEALGIFADYESQGMKVRLRDILKDMDFLSDEQVKKINARQKLVHVRETDRIFIKLVTVRGLVSPDIVAEYVKKQEAHWKKTGQVDRVGEMMMSDGALDGLKFTELIVEVGQLQERIRKGEDLDLDAIAGAGAGQAQAFDRFKTCPDCGYPMPLNARACKVCQDRAAGIRVEPAPAAPEQASNKVEIELPSRPAPAEKPTGSRGKDKAKESTGVKKKLAAVPDAPDADDSGPATARDIRFQPEGIKPPLKEPPKKTKDSRVGRAVMGGALAELKGKGALDSAPPEEPATAEIPTPNLPARPVSEVRMAKVPARRGAPMGLIVVGVLVVLGAGAGIFFMMKKPDDGGVTVANNASPANTNVPVAVEPTSLEDLLAAAQKEPKVERRLELFEKALALKADESDAILGRASCFVLLGRDEDARRELDAALKANPKNGMAALWRAMLGLRNGAPAADVETDLAAAVASADRAAGPSAAGFQFLLKREWIPAHGQFNKVLENFKGFHPALVGRARAYRGLGKHRESSSDIEAALNGSAEAPDALFWRGFLRNEDGRCQPALEDFTRATQLGLDTDHATYLRSVAALGCGNYAAAASGLDRLVQKNPKRPDYLFGRAQAYEGQGEFQLALADLDTALAVDPGLIHARVLKVHLLLAQDEVAKARAEADAIVSEKPDRWDALLARAEVRVAQGDLEGARAEVKKAGDLAGDQEDALLGLVRIHYVLGDEKEADRTAEKLAKAFPRNVAVQALRGTWFARHGRPQEARACAHRLLEISTDDALGITLRGTADLLEGKKADGLAAFEEAIRRSPGLIEPLVGRAKAHLAVQQAGTAGSLLGELMKDYERRPFGHNLRGLIYQIEGKTDDASRAYQIALDREPRFAPAINNIGAITFASGDYAGAIKQFDRALAVDRLLSAAHVNRAYALVASGGDLRDALRSWRRGVELNPMYAEGVSTNGEPAPIKPAVGYLFDAQVVAPPKSALHCLAGYVRLDSGRVRDAMECFKTAAAADSQNTWALNGLGLAESADGHPEDAAKTFARAIELRRDVSEFHANLGHVLYKLGKPEEAVARFDEALRLDPASGSAYGHRGRIQLDRRDYAKALEDLSKALEFDPENPAALASRGRAFMESGDFARGLVDLDAALKFTDPVRFPPSERRNARLQRFALLARAGTGLRVAQEWPTLFLIHEDKIDEVKPDLDALDRYHKELSDEIADLEGKRSDNKIRAQAYHRRAVVRMMKSDFVNALVDLGKSTEADPLCVEYRFSRGCAYLLQGELDSAVLEWGYLQRKRLMPAGEPGSLYAHARSPYSSLGVVDGEAELYEWLMKLSKEERGIAAAASFESAKDYEQRMAAAGAQYALKLRDDLVRAEAEPLLNEAGKAAATNRERGRAYYQEVIQKFPHTSFADLAKQKIKELDKQ